MTFISRMFSVALIAGLLFPLPVGAQVTGIPGAPETIKEEDVRQFIDLYVNRYKAKDIDLFMDLYSKRSVENQILPYEDIRVHYRRMFAETNQFLYYPTIYTIDVRGPRAYAAGRYKVVQTLKKGNEMRTFQGNIQWDLIREEGALRIREINFGMSR
jgi:hypothetical protein